MYKSTSLTISWRLLYHYSWVTHVMIQMTTSLYVTQTKFNPSFAYWFYLVLLVCKFSLILDYFHICCSRVIKFVKLSTISDFTTVRGRVYDTLMVERFISPLRLLQRGCMIVFHPSICLSVTFNVATCTKIRFKLDFFFQLRGYNGFKVLVCRCNFVWCRIFYILKPSAFIFCMYMFYDLAYYHIRIRSP